MAVNGLSQIPVNTSSSSSCYALPEDAFSLVSFPGTDDTNKANELKTLPSTSEEKGKEKDNRADVDENGKPYGIHNPRLPFDVSPKKADSSQIFSEKEILTRKVKNFFKDLIDRLDTKQQQEFYMRVLQNIEIYSSAPNDEIYDLFVFNVLEKFYNYDHRSKEDKTWWIWEKAGVIGRDYGAITSVIYSFGSWCLSWFSDDVTQRSPDYLLYVISARIFCFFENCRTLKRYKDEKSNLKVWFAAANINCKPLLLSYKTRPYKVYVLIIQQVFLKGTGIIKKEIKQEKEQGLLNLSNTLKNSIDSFNATLSSSLKQEKALSSSEGILIHVQDFLNSQLLANSKQISAKDSEIKKLKVELKTQEAELSLLEALVDNQTQKITDLEKIIVDLKYQLSLKNADILLLEQQLKADKAKNT